jgi:hypothetical protein
MVVYEIPGPFTFKEKWDLTYGSWRGERTQGTPVWGSHVVSEEATLVQSLPTSGLVTRLRGCVFRQGLE